MKTMYVLPRPDFWMLGATGRVAHAIGVVAGLTKNGAYVTVVSSTGARAQVSEMSPSTEVREAEAPGRGRLAAIRWALRLRSLLSSILQDPTYTVVIIRYAVSNAFIFIPLLKRFSDRTRVFEVNSLAFHQLHSLPRVVRQTYLLVEKWYLKHADLVYVVSTALKEDLVQGRGGLPSEKVVVVPNGGPPPLWSRVQNARPGSPPRFIYLGRFQPYYELRLVIEAFSQLISSGKDSELHLYGDGRQRPDVEKTVTGVPNVHLHGPFVLEDVLDAGEITENDVLVLPYAPPAEARIHSPIKLYEYMALGLPILASSAGQITETLEDNLTTKLYTPGDKASLVEAMRTLVDNAELRSELSKNIRAEYADRHTWAARMHALLSHVTMLQHAE